MILFWTKQRNHISLEASEFTELAIHSSPDVVTYLKQCSELGANFFIFYQEVQWGYFGRRVNLLRGTEKGKIWVLPRTCGWQVEWVESWTHACLPPKPSAAESRDWAGTCAACIPWTPSMNLKAYLPTASLSIQPPQDIMPQGSLSPAMEEIS